MAWVRYQICGTVTNRPYPRRGRAPSDREDRLIRFWATGIYKSTATTLKNQLAESIGIRT